MIDWTKPIETFGGIPARAVSFNTFDSKYPIAVIIEDKLYLSNYDGKINHDTQLLYVQNKKPLNNMLYLNIYDDGTQSAFPSRLLADQWAISKPYIHRIACVKVIYHEGQRDD